MGKLNEGILGDFSGKVSNIVGVVVNGKNYVRKRPAKSSIPRSDKQANQRTKMVLLTPIFRNLKPFLALSFKEKALESNQHTYNVAKSYNLKTGIKGSYPNQEIDWEGIVLSEGSRAKAEKVGVTTTDMGFEIQWDINYDIMKGAGYDRTMIFAYCLEDSLASTYSMDGARRSELKDILPINKNLKGKTFQIFLTFKDARSDEVSKSVYCGGHVF